MMLVSPPLESHFLPPSGLALPASSFLSPSREGPIQGPMTQARGGGGCFGCRSADAGALCSYILLNLLPEEGARALERGLDGPH